MKKLFFLLVLFAGVGVVGWQVAEKRAAESKQVRPKKRTVTVAVEIAPVRKGPIRDVKQFTGGAPQSDDITALYLKRDQ